MRIVLNRQGNPQPIPPELYDAHHQRHSEDIPFWLALARRQPGALLELGCGTGRVLLPLANAGVNICGLDTDWHALEFLKSRATAKPSLSINVFQADFARFHLSRQFNLIILPCNTLSTVPQSQRLALFDCIYAHLSKDGWFAASLPSPSLLHSMPAAGEEQIEDIFPHPLDGGMVQVSSAWKRDDQFFHVTWIYEHRLPNGTIERAHTHVSHSLDLADVYLHQLEQAGLPFVRAYGSFDGTPYRSRSNHLILIASGQSIPSNLSIGAKRKWKN